METFDSGQLMFPGFFVCSWAEVGNVAITEANALTLIIYIFSTKQNKTDTALLRYDELTWK